MTHIMLDLETLSTHCNAAILAIGAVKFDAEKKVYDKFYQAVKTPPEVEGFHVSIDTLDWWSQQSEEAQAVFNDPHAIEIEEALRTFTYWALKDSARKNIRLWGNGAAFDNPILSTAYQLCGLEQPWMHWNNRCYKTLRAHNATVPLTRIGTFHNAVDDAETQAVHLLAMEIELA